MKHNEFAKKTAYASGFLEPNAARRVLQAKLVGSFQVISVMLGV